jgi:nucleoid DNA-binding protein
LKLASILAEYLYQQQKLDIAGIGRFTVTIARLDPDGRNPSQAVNFENNTTIKEDEGLVEYISKHTGKMRALASSDLNSYIDLAKEFLNIGKPFQLEGIGTLVKKRSGEYDFTSDNSLLDKGKEGMKELAATSTSDESFTTYENLRPHMEKSAPYTRLFYGLLIIATTVIILWGGYTLYKNKTSGPAKTDENSVTPVTENNQRLSEPGNQSSNQPSENNSNAQISVNPHPVPTSSSQAVNPPAGSHKFIIEVAGRQRALKRFNQLKEFSKVRMTTGDSVTYKLFFVLPATASDTARIRDSLHVVYPALNKRKGWVEW